MTSLLDFPIAVCALSIVVLCLCAWLGATVVARYAALTAEARDSFGAVVAASLTLLGLIVGFSFSMAISRYDQRKDYEEAEANAIGTEYVRAELLPAADAAQLQGLLREYVGQRILYYSTRDAAQLQRIDSQTAQLQAQLWASVRAAAAAQPTPLVALTVAGMNDVLNAQGYTRAAWWNRIPLAAWALMGVIAMLCNVLVGHVLSHLPARNRLLPILPLLLSIAFLMIADIDSPRGGVIHVGARNLQSLAQSLH